MLPSKNLFRLSAALWIFWISGQAPHAAERRNRTPEYQVEGLERDPPPGWRVERNWAPLGDRGNPLKRDYDKWDCKVDGSSRTIRCDK